MPKIPDDLGKAKARAAKDQAERDIKRKLGEDELFKAREDLEKIARELGIDPGMMFACRRGR